MAAVHPLHAYAYIYVGASIGLGSASGSGDTTLHCAVFPNLLLIWGSLTPVVIPCRAAVIFFIWSLSVSPIFTFFCCLKSLFSRWLVKQ